MRFFEFQDQTRVVLLEPYLAERNIKKTSQHYEYVSNYKQKYEQIQKYKKKYLK